MWTLTHFFPFDAGSGCGSMALDFAKSCANYSGNYSVVWWYCRCLHIRDGRMSMTDTEKNNVILFSQLIMATFWYWIQKLAWFWICYRLQHRLLIKKNYYPTKCSWVNPTCTKWPVTSNLQFSDTHTWFYFFLFQDRENPN